MTILRELFFGNLTAPIDSYMKFDRKYRQLSDKTEQEKEYFKDLLPNEDCEQFEQLFESYNELALIEVRESFVCGFKLAVRIISEAHSD
jgi:hypothetical protein